MKMVNSCLTIPSTAKTYELGVRDLDAQSVDVDLGGTIHAIDFTGDTIFFLKRSNPPSLLEMGQMPDCYIIMGEVTLTEQNLVDFQIRYRHGNARYIWAPWQSVLQCPKCQNMASPNDEDNSSFALTQQQLYQISEPKDEADQQVPLSTRLFPRLFCVECFNDVAKDITLNGYDPVGRRHVKVPMYPRGLHSCVMKDEAMVSAYDLITRWDLQGKNNVVNHDLANSTFKAMGLKKSKSRTKRNKGMPPASRPINSCNLPSCKTIDQTKLKACGRCSEVRYDVIH